MGSAGRSYGRAKVGGGEQWGGCLLALWVRGTNSKHEEGEAERRLTASRRRGETRQLRQAAYARCSAPLTLARCLLRAEREQGS
jgi:hypothetical protein